MRKIVLLGDGAVGKTSLIRKFVQDEFSDEYLVTFGTKVTKKVITYDDTELTLLIWDILGQRKHTHLHAAYFQGASGAIVVSDVSRKVTLKSMDEWLTSFREVAGNKPTVYLANKYDIPNASFGEDELEAVAKKLKAPHFMTSAKTGMNVELAFTTMGEMMLDKKKKK